MGPRSDERGNTATRIANKRLVTLQWGRARMSAEIRRNPTKRTLGSFCFNGAALG